MATPLPKVESSGGLDSILKLFSTISPTLGSGKTTSTTKGSLDPEASGQADALLQSILGQNNSGDLDLMIQDILTQAKQQFGPNLSASIGAGNRALTDTVLAQVQNEALARATAASAKARLDFTAANNRTAAGLVEAKLNNTSTKTNTSQTSMSPAGKASSAIGTALAGYSVYKNIFGKKKRPGSSGDDSVFSNPQPGDLSSDAGVSPGGAGSPVGAADADNALDFGGGFGEDQFAELEQALGIVDEASPVVGDTITGGGAGGGTGPQIGGSDGVAGLIPELSYVDPITNLIGESTIIDGGKEILTESILDPSLITAGGDIAAGAAEGYEYFDALGDSGQFLNDITGEVLNLGIGFPYLTAARLGGEILGINEVGDAINLASGGIADVGGDLLDFFGDAFNPADSVICTELVRQGLLNKDLWNAGKWHIGKLSKEVIAGYHLWAKPYVKLMQKYSLATKFIAPFAIGRYKYISGEWNLLGWFTVKFGEPFCYYLGKRVS